MNVQSNIGDWSNGMIGVSKTFGGSSILSSPAKKRLTLVNLFFVSSKIANNYFCTIEAVVKYIAKVIGRKKQFFYALVTI